MAEPDPPEDPPDAADLQSFAQDWITIWHSELAGAATDREAQEAWQAMVALWAGTAGAMASLLPGGVTAQSGAHGSHDGRTARPAAPAGTAAADASPDARDAEVERLAGRVAELERRLAEFEGTCEPKSDAPRPDELRAGGPRPGGPERAADRPRRARPGGLDGKRR